MSRTAQIREFFGDGYYDFKIGVAQAEELQDLFDCGLMVLLDRVASLCTKEIRQTLRVGLVGGGMRKEDAYRLVETHAIEAYWLDCAATAGEAIRAALKGAPDEPLGERKGETAPRRSPAARSATKSSSASPAPQASADATSSKARSGNSGRSSKAGSKPTASAKTA
jgi:hypothetical protein